MIIQWDWVCPKLLPPSCWDLPWHRRRVGLIPPALSSSLRRSTRVWVITLIFCDTPSPGPVVHPSQPFPWGLSPPQQAVPWVGFQDSFSGVEAPLVPRRCTHLCLPQEAKPIFPANDSALSPDITAPGLSPTLRVLQRGAKALLRSSSVPNCLDPCLAAPQISSPSGHLGTPEQACR